MVAMQKAPQQSPALTPAHAMGELHRTGMGAESPAISGGGYWGNQAALRRMSKLEIGAVDDPLEAEADRVAGQVMRMPDPAVSSPPVSQVLRRKCAACEEEDDKTVRPKRAFAGEPALTEAPAIVHAALRSPGHSLDTGTGAFFESRLGRDLSAVRVHTDAKAAASARAIGARAYTVGSHLIFGDGAYAPHSSAGKLLLAHELAHVIQQERPVSPRQWGSGHAGLAPHSRPGLVPTLRRDPADNPPTPAAAKAPPSAEGQSVLDALNKKDPIGGVGDVNEALRILRGLTPEKLLTALIDVDDQAQIDLLVGAVGANDQTEVGAAIYAVRFTSSNGAPSDQFGIQAAQGMATLPEKDQDIIIAAVLKRRGSSATVKEVREGLAALLESESARQAAPAEDADSSASGAAAMMAGIVLGPWNPNGMPIPFYIGNSAHVAIAAAYALLHSTDSAFYNFSPVLSILQAAAALGITVSPILLTAAQLGLKPDIANISKHQLYEIKPTTLQATGRAEALIYSAALTAAGLVMALGPTNEPGTSGTLPAPGGWFVYSAPEPGVITYNYRQPGQRKPANDTVPVPVPAPDPSLVKKVSLATGLTGTALVIYLIISEGSRVFLPRNAIPIP
jgi:hypothetical protein